MLHKDAVTLGKTVIGVCGTTKIIPSAFEVVTSKKGTKCEMTSTQFSIFEAT